MVNLDVKALRPAVPSSSQPVMMRPTTRGPKACAVERKSGFNGGAEAVLARPARDADVAGRLDQQVIVRRRDVDAPALELPPVFGGGHSNKKIAARLNLSVKTIQAHKANAMRKLGLTSRIDIVRYAILQGWLQKK